MLTFGAKTYADKRIAVKERQHITQRTYLIKEAKIFVGACITAVIVAHIMGK